MPKPAKTNMNPEAPLAAERGLPGPAAASPVSTGAALSHLGCLLDYAFELDFPLTSFS